MPRKKPSRDPWNEQEAQKQDLRAARPRQNAPLVLGNPTKTALELRREAEIKERAEREQALFPVAETLQRPRLRKGHVQLPQGVDFQFSPVMDRIVTLRVDADVEREIGSLIALPDESREMSQIVAVVAVGGDVRDKNIQPGAFLLVGKYSGSNFVFRGTTYYLVTEPNVDLVLHPIVDAQEE
jgi:co-chaperonin GroES (HSP10)